MLETSDRFTIDGLFRTEGEHELKKCLVINMFSKRESSYSLHYTRILESRGVPYDVVYFERYGYSYQPAENERIISRDCPTGGNKIKKLKPMLEYAAFIRSLLKRNEYGSAILLTTVPAVLAADILLKKYRDNFILDIRDYTHENNGLYYWIVNKLTDAAASVVLSSEGFKSFLPESEKYVVTHNIAVDYAVTDRSPLERKEHYNIGFVGSIRYFEENSALIWQLRDQAKYSLHYFGTHAVDCDLEAFCRDEGIGSVTFHGRFENEQKAEIYKQIDFINSIYPSHGLETTTAVPNRFYDAAIYRCPIIVTRGTFLEKMVEKFHLGFAVDMSKDSIVDALEAYIQSFDRKAFIENCDAMLDMVRQDIETFHRAVDDFASRAGKN